MPETRVRSRASRSCWYCPRNIVRKIRMPMEDRSRTPGNRQRAKSKNADKPRDGRERLLVYDATEGWIHAFRLKTKSRRPATFCLLPDTLKDHPPNFRVARRGPPIAHTSTTYRISMFAACANPLQRCIRVMFGAHRSIRAFLFFPFRGIRIRNVVSGGYRDEYNAPRGGSSPLSASAAGALTKPLGVAAIS